MFFGFFLLFSLLPIAGAAFCIIGIIKRDWRKTPSAYAARVSISFVIALVIGCGVGGWLIRLSGLMGGLFMVAVVFILPLAIIIFFLTGLVKRIKNNYYWLAARVIFSMSASVAVYYAAFYGMIYGMSHTFDSDRRRIFTDNFAMPVSNIHDLKGVESAWMGYGAWISFTYEGELTLKHPEHYQDVSCTPEMIQSSDPFIENDAHPSACEHCLHDPTPDSWIRNIEKYPALKKYPLSYQEHMYQQCVFEQAWKKLEAMLPNLQCKKGNTNFWTDPNGKELSDSSQLIYNPQTHQALFEITE